MILLLKDYIVLMLLYVVCVVISSVKFIYLQDKPIHFRNGVSGKGKNMISKHDANLSAKKNAKRVIEQVFQYCFP